jgi:hypothetical protein
LKKSRVDSTRVLLLHLHHATLSCNLSNLRPPPRPPSAPYWLGCGSACLPACQQ